MKVRYLNLKGGLRYLITTDNRIYTSSDIQPTKYNSYILPQEIYDSRKTVRLHTSTIGVIIDGVYHGLLGEYKDYNGNTFSFSFDNGTFRGEISSTHGGHREVTYSSDCHIHFASRFPNSSDSEDQGSFGFSIVKDWEHGRWSTTATELAAAFFSDEGRYNAFLGEYGNRNIINIGFIDAIFTWTATIKDIQNAKYFGLCPPYSEATGAYLPIGKGEGQIDVEDSVSDEDPEDDDPYNDDDESGSGGGDGDHDDSSDDVDFPTLPDLSAVDTGFITLYNPSVVELKNLANYMWSNLFDLDTLKKLFADPMDAILGLSIVPVDVPAGSSQVVKVGNISTGISMTKAARQYVEVDCGYVDVKKYWGAYLDYDPYTKFELYLPYVGTKFITADDIMGKRVHIKYHVDVLSGACVAYVKCGSSVLYNFQGQCSCEVPVNGNDWSATIEAAVSIAATAATMAATGAPATVSPEALNEKNASKVARQYASNYNTQRAYNGEIANAVGGAASSAINVTKPAIERSGSFGSMGGMLGIQKPYLVATRPRHCVPGNQNKYQGYPAFITRNLGSLSGYTEIDSIIIDYIDGTDAEIAELVSILQGGVIL